MKRQKKLTDYDRAYEAYKLGRFIIADSPYGRANVRAMAKRGGFASIQTLGGWQIAASCTLTIFENMGEAQRYLNEKKEQT